MVDRCSRTCRSSSSSDDETEIESELDSHEISDVEDEYEKENLYIKKFLQRIRNALSATVSYVSERKKKKRQGGFKE